MKKRNLTIVFLMIICMAALLGLTACDGGEGGGGNEGGGGKETNAADFSYITTDNGVMITSYNGSEKSITLPSNHPNGSVVVGISYDLSSAGTEKAPFENTNVEEIHIPANIIIMRNGKGIYDGDMVRHVFYRAKSLKKITVAQDNYAYASRDGALYDKAMTTLLVSPYNIESLTVPEGVKTIAPNAFKYDYSLGNGVETAFNSTFENFGTFSSRFSTISLPSTLQSFSFEGCRQLSTVDLTRTNVTEIKIGAFRQCLNLKTVILPDRLQTIGTSAFQNSGIESITIPQNARAIDLTHSQDGSVTTKERATDIFSFCRNLTTIIGPAQVLFGEKTSDVDHDGTHLAITSAINQFLGCNRLRGITVNGANPGMGGKAYSVTDVTYDTGWCSLTDAFSHTFSSLQYITYQNGCFMQLNSMRFSDFTERYPNVTINK